MAHKNNRSKRVASKGISRSAFLKIGLVGTLGLLGLGGLGIHFLTKRNYNEWHKQNFSRSKGVEFTHSSFLKNYTPSEQQRAFLENELYKRTGREVLVLESKFIRDKKLIALDVPERVIAEYSERSQEAIRDFFAYAGEKNVSFVTFHRLSPETNLLVPERNNIPMYLVWKTFDVVKAQYEIEIRGKRAQGEVVVEESSVGETISSFKVHFGDEGIVLKEEKMQVPILALGFGAVATYTSPPAEALHYVLRWRRIENAVKKINEKWAAAGKPSKLEGTLLNKILEEGLIKEEGVVHGLLDQFIEERRQQLGFSNEAVHNYQKHNSDRHYALVLCIRELIRKRGPVGVLEAYKKNSLPVQQSTY
jgi:hypothetical protein